MRITPLRRGPLGYLALLGLVGLLMAEPVLADAPLASERSPIEFRLHPVESTPLPDADIWTPADPQVLLETQAELSALRPQLDSLHEERAPFGDAVLSTLTTLPIVGQFANREWMKGLIALGTAAGLATAIVVGSDQNNPQLVRLGTLGLYPLAVFGSLDAYVTRANRAPVEGPAR